MVFASCWSHYSPINTFLCARGLFAVLTLKKERSDLTINRVFELNKEQRAYLKMVVDDPMIDGRLITKDLIIAGKYHLDPLCLGVHLDAIKNYIYKICSYIPCYACCTFLSEDKRASKNQKNCSKVGSFQGWSTSRTF